MRRLHVRAASQEHRESTAENGWQYLHVPRSWGPHARPAQPAKQAALFPGVVTESLRIWQRVPRMAFPSRHAALGRRGTMPRISNAGPRWLAPIIACAAEKLAVLWALPAR